MSDARAGRRSFIGGLLAGLASLFAPWRLCEKQIDGGLTQRRKGAKEEWTDERYWVDSVAVFDEQLYAAGNFPFIGDGVNPVRLARWNGSEWEAMDGSRSDIRHPTSDMGEP